MNIPLVNGLVWLFICLQSVVAFDKFWFCFQNKCYLKIENEVAFEDLMKTCQEENAVPLSIHSKEENEYLTRIIWGDGNHWLPLVNVSGVEQWMDGTPFDYTKYNKRYTGQFVFNRLGQWFQSTKKFGYAVCQVDVTIDDDTGIVQVKSDGVGVAVTARDQNKSSNEVDLATNVDVKEGIQINENNSAVTWINGKLCSSNWLYFNKTCYWIKPYQRYRIVNEFNCKRKHASMVSIHSKHLMAMIFSGSGVTRYWLNGRRELAARDGYMWMDDTLTDFHFFNDDVPFAEDDIYMVADRHAWRFVNSKAIAGQICSKPANIV